jgi:hypothetical protein
MQTSSSTITYFSIPHVSNNQSYLPIFVENTKPASASVSFIPAMKQTFKVLEYMRNEIMRLVDDWLSYLLPLAQTALCCAFQLMLSAC